MKVVFLGVGEAFDEEQPNSSHLILSDTKLLLDCGYSVPRQLWNYNTDPSFLDGLFISHKHADHCFGIPPLLVRMWEEKRDKPLSIIGKTGIESTVNKLMKYGYQGFYDDSWFEMNFIDVESKDTIKLNELELSFISTAHTAPNLAIKVSDGKNVMCYSGDGVPNSETEEFYRNADLVIHDAYLVDRRVPGHGCITDLLEMAERNNIKCLALTHIRRDLRDKAAELVKTTSEDVKVIIPGPSDSNLEVYMF